MTKNVGVKQIPEDLYARYDRTFIRYNGTVYFVRCTSEWDDVEEIRFRLFRPSYLDNPVHVVSPYDDGIDTKSVKLGYVNYPEGCAYVQRSPIRQWRQGVSCYCLEDAIGHYTYTEFAEYMLDGIYPSVNEALNILRHPSTKYNCIAISRDIMLVDAEKGRVDIIFRETWVGEIPNPLENMTFVIDTEHLAWAMRPYLRGINWRLKNDDDL